ncbi:ABC transporter ATP-binding protein [Paenibacillus larvae]|nr:ABC transporter ATP-binding protein [Paenibacillus larvae]MDT2238192.1 ABC transporter ATP-binding protein [Paenibacillus larvae]
MKVLKLDIEKLTKRFSQHVAVHEIQTVLSPGIYGLVGPNGAGKTTLLRMLAGVMHPTSGHVLWNGQSVKGKAGEQYRNQLGYLPQELGLYPSFTVERFLRYIAALKGLSKAETGESIERVLNLVNLKSKQSVKIKELSGGMRRRLGIAQALLNDPKVMLLDEPTTALDPEERLRFRNVIQSLSGNRIIIISTHIMSDIEQLADYLLILKEGRLVANHSPGKLIEELEGMVWNVTSDTELLHTLSRNYLIGNLGKQEDHYRVTVIAKEPPSHKAVPQRPCLEDVYVWLFGSIELPVEGVQP